MFLLLLSRVQVFMPKTPGRFFLARAFLRSTFHALSFVFELIDVIIPAISITFFFYIS